MRWDQIRFSIDFIVVIQRFDAVRSVCVARTAVQCSSQHRLQPAEMARRTVNVVGQLGLARRADRSAAYSLAIAASICSRTSRPCRAGPWLGHPKWSRKAHRAGSSRAATTTHKKCPPLEGASGSGRAFFVGSYTPSGGAAAPRGLIGTTPSFVAVVGSAPICCCMSEHRKSAALTATLLQRGVLFRLRRPAKSLLWRRSAQLQAKRGRHQRSSEALRSRGGGIRSPQAERRSESQLQRNRSAQKRVQVAMARSCGANGLYLVGAVCGALARATYI